MSWLERLIPAGLRPKTDTPRHSVPEGLWRKCDGCEEVLYGADLTRNLEVCPKCGHHHRIAPRLRLEALLDPEGQEELGVGLEPADPLRFRDSKRYRDRLSQAQKATGERDALIVMAGSMEGVPVVAATFNFEFMGGSMASVVGQKFLLAAEAAMSRRAGLISFTASGGARMQEGLFSLMQMARTSAVLGRLRDAGLPYVVVLTDPTMGGVSASLAMLGDVQLAEPGALIGFAGPRVIEQTVREQLPEGFQRAEFLLEHGFVDAIVARGEQRAYLAELLRKLLPQPAAEPERPKARARVEGRITERTERNAAVVAALPGRTPS